MSEDKTIKVLQVKECMYGGEKGINSFLSSIPQEDIYKIKMAHRQFGHDCYIFYWTNIPQCPLCGFGIVDERCHNCNTCSSESDKHALVEDELEFCSLECATEELDEWEHLIKRWFKL